MTSQHMTMDAAVAEIVRRAPWGLIAIDGLPCAGKSTMADRLGIELKAPTLALDDFALPESAWRHRAVPAFPFPTIRYDEFMTSIRALASESTCSFHPFDWSRLEISPRSRTVTRSGPLIVEGVSALHEPLCDCYEIRVFIESERGSTLEVALARGRGLWTDAWRELFLPSVDIYMATRPERRADILVAGRGVTG